MAAGQALLASRGLGTLSVSIDPCQRKTFRKGSLRLHHLFFCRKPNLREGPFTKRKRTSSTGMFEYSFFGQAHQQSTCQWILFETFGYLPIDHWVFGAKSPWILLRAPRNQSGVESILIQIESILMHLHSRAPDPFTRPNRKRWLPVLSSSLLQSVDEALECTGMKANNYSHVTCNGKLSFCSCVKREVRRLDCLTRL